MNIKLRKGGRILLACVLIGQTNIILNELGGLVICLDVKIIYAKILQSKMIRPHIDSS